MCICIIVDTYVYVSIYINIVRIKMTANQEVEHTSNERQPQINLIIGVKGSSYWVKGTVKVT